jgi:UDP-N-acetylglucosamine 1-carboxyvinyltransferase
MDSIEIEGGRPLRGEVTVSGSKNATLPQIAAALLAPGRSTFRNVPDLADIRTMGRLIANMGPAVTSDRGTLQIDATELGNPEAPYELVKTMRASVLVLGPLVARCGRARVSLPGGCAIGARPIDQHLKALQALGARIELAHGYVQATVDGRLHIAAAWSSICRR